jgi:hypothetical protein
VTVLKSREVLWCGQQVFALTATGVAGCVQAPAEILKQSPWFGGGSHERGQADGRACLPIVVNQPAYSRLGRRDPGAHGHISKKTPTTGALPHPAPGTRQRSDLTAALRRPRLFGLGTAVLLAPCLAGCGSGSSVPTLTTVAVERAVAQSILTQHHLHATVNCPSKVPQEAGLVFTCAASLDVGTYPVSVTETNGGGHVRYQNQVLFAEEISSGNKAAH